MYQIQIFDSWEECMDSFTAPSVRLDFEREDETFEALRTLIDAGKGCSVRRYETE